MEHIFKHLKPNVEVPSFYFWGTCDTWFATVSEIAVWLGLEGASGDGLFHLSSTKHGQLKLVAQDCA